MNSRIALVLKTKNMSSAQLADELGVQRSGISHILNGRNKPSLDFILRIIKKYPDISVTWLLFGEGPMMNPYPFQSTGEMKLKANIQKSMLELFNDTGEEAENNFTQGAPDTEKDPSLVTENQIFTPIFDNDQKEPQKKAEIVKEHAGPDVEKPGFTADSIRIPEQGIISENIGLEKPDSLQTKAAKIERIIIFYNDRSFKEYYPD